MAFKSGFGSGAWPAPARVLSCAPCGRPGAVALLGGADPRCPVEFAAIEGEGHRVEVQYSVP